MTTIDTIHTAVQPLSPKRVTITVRFEALVDDKIDTSEAVGYVLDSGAMQDAIIEYGADHGCKIEIERTWHDVEPGSIDDNT